MIVDFVRGWAGLLGAGNSSVAVAHSNKCRGSSALLEGAGPVSWWLFVRVATVCLCTLLYARLVATAHTGQLYTVMAISLAHCEMQIRLQQQQLHICNAKVVYQSQYAL